MIIGKIVLTVLFGLSVPGQAEGKNKVDQAIGTIHKIDLSDDRPKAPNYVLLILDVKRLSVPGARAHVILRQFSNRVRAEFEGTALPKGAYKIAVAENCPQSASLSPDSFKRSWTELHSFTSSSMHTSTERSSRNHSLRENGKGLSVLEGKSLGLFRVLKGKLNPVDCKPVL